jgi:EAL domain-containing protein (putative c-di-GMP-specific phosphodiesterase class I)
VAPRPERFTTYHVRLSDIAASLHRDRSMACLFVDLSHLREVERELGPTHHADVMARAGDLLDRMRGDRLRRDDLICRTEDADGYLCFLASPRDAGGSPVDLEAIASRVEANLERALSDALAGFTREQPRVMVGFSRVLDNPMVRPERLLVRLVGEAHRSALLHRERAIQRHRTHLQEIILRGMLQSVYQPIVDMASGTIFGFEALARGPRDSSLETPTALFSVADEVELTFELDRACFRSALVGAVGLEPVHRLFVNLLPTSFYDSSFIESEVANLLAAAELTPANVVFEITEKLAIENFASFRQALAGYTRAGFGVAIDDVGTRHSNLETVMALRPDFIKLSDVLTRGVSKSTVKREMVRSLQRIAEAIDAVIVAEGIEGPEDLTVLCDVGVRYGQGFFLARPGPAFPQLRASVRRVVRAAGRRRWADVPAVILVPDPALHGDPVDGDGLDCDSAEPTRPGRIGRALRAADLAVGTDTVERDDQMRAAASEARAAEDAQRPAALLGARRAASPVMDAFSDEETTSSDP